jgi:microcystin-dependent protein
MSDPFIGEIRAFGFNFAPVGWAKCQGQLLSIQQYSALYALLGTQYGGNGTTTFGLPNLQGRMIIGDNVDHVIGTSGGQESVTLTVQQIPSHAHAVTLSGLTATLNGLNDDGDIKTPGGHCLANNTSDAYSTDVPNAAMHAGSIAISGTPTCGTTGGSLSHDNMPPYQVLNYCIATMGIFPTRE